MPKNLDIEPKELNVNLKEKLKTLPTSPGVYLHKNKNDKIIYIGKAKNLRNRVRSYFQDTRHSDAKTKALVSKIADFDIIVVDSEAEALILEDTLVKKHRPRYNILLKDDKSYPYIRITKEDFPRIFATRKIIKDGSKYFGPYTDVGHMKRVLRVLRSIFLLRSCDLNLTEKGIKENKWKICLDYHIKKCDGPCEGWVSKDTYSNKIKSAIQILNGKTSEIQNSLKEEMESLAEQMKFEEAAVIKNRLMILKEYLEHQKIISTDSIDRDVLGLSKIENSVCTLIFKIREGKLIGKRHFIIPDIKDDSITDIIKTSLEKLYLETDFIPKEIFIPELPDNLDFLNNYLTQKQRSNVEILVPKIGEKKKLVNLASTNAEYILREYHISLLKREQTIPRTIQSMQRDLRLPKLPRHIECFDNSHIQGSELVSSCVVFKDGKASKNDYRKFKIKTVFKNDDFAAMKETVGRRYKRLISENQSLPDLIIIDGGKGQLSAAVKILEELGIKEKVIVVGLAKKLEEIFFPGKSEPVLLPKTSSSLKLIQQVRDEAHRFAITFHRELRDKRILSTVLTEIEGIGEKTANKLLIDLGSVENIKNSSKEDLEKFTKKIKAEKIFEYFHKNEK